jgi:transcriptional regulator with XRE-family HTH domain
MHLRTLRKRRGWTQVELSRQTEIAQNSISRLERDRHARPAMATVIALAKALQVAPTSIRFGPPRRARMPQERRSAAPPRETKGGAAC